MQEAKPQASETSTYAVPIHVLLLLMTWQGSPAISFGDERAACGEMKRFLSLVLNVHSYLRAILQFSICDI